jgi:hypothetical protein
LQPNLTGNFLAAQLETEKNNWERADAHRQNIDNIDRALIVEFFRTIPADIIEDVETDINTAQDTTFLQVFDRYWAEYGNPTPAEITENRDSMEAAWNPSAGENFTKVMRQMRDGQRFAVYTDSAYTDKQMVNMGENKLCWTHNVSRVHMANGWKRPRPTKPGPTSSSTSMQLTKFGKSLTKLHATLDTEEEQLESGDRAVKRAKRPLGKIWITSTPPPMPLTLPPSNNSA